MITLCERYIKEIKNKIWDDFLKYCNQSRVRVYLSGPMDLVDSTTAKSWREYATKLFQAYNIEVDDPTSRDYTNKDKVAFADQIVTDDKHAILGCDYVLLNQIIISVGTSMEALFAYDHDIPVISVVMNKSTVSPWLVYHSEMVFTKLDDAIFHIIEDVKRKRGEQ